MTQDQFDKKYHRDYYLRNVSKHATESAPEIAAGIMEIFHPQSVVDIGCGAGDLLAFLRDHYKLKVSGFERAKAAIALAREKNIEVRQFDIEEKVFAPSPGYDVAICMEVAEHVSYGAADFLVWQLSRLAEQIIFTAAPPGQGGNGHVNEQPRQYWIEKFEKQGRIYDSYATHYLIRKWKNSGTVTSWYWKNLMIFRKQKSEYFRTATQKRTICEVLREIWDIHPDEKTRTLLQEAEDMAKRMALKLLQYNKEVFRDWWEENPDYEADLNRRLEERLR